MSKLCKIHKQKELCGIDCACSTILRKKKSPVKSFSLIADTGGDGEGVWDLMSIRHAKEPEPGGLAGCRKPRDCSQKQPAGRPAENSRLSQSFGRGDKQGGIITVDK